MVITVGITLVSGYFAGIEGIVSVNALEDLDAVSKYERRDSPVCGLGVLRGEKHSTTRNSMDGLRGAAGLYLATFGRKVNPCIERRRLCGPACNANGSGGSGSVSVLAFYSGEGLGRYAKPALFR